MRQIWTFHIPGKLVFGAGSIEQIGEIARRHGERVLIVTDAVLVKSGVVDRVKQPLVAAGADVSVFDGGEPEPSFKAAETCIAAAKQFRADVLVGVGGGSNMDLAKITAGIMAHGGRIVDYVGDDKFPGPVWPLICVPTTAGTGSEVSAASVLTDTVNHIKVGVLSNFLRPLAAIVDPMLTVSCPPKVTADSGIDALTHAIEAFTAVDNESFPLPEGEKSVYQGRHPLGECLAEKAIALVGINLRLAVSDGKNIGARTGMALGATLAGMAFSNIGVALVHAMEYPVGGAVHVSHGAGNGLLLPHVMRYNLPARLTAFAQIARLLGEKVDGMAAPEAALRAVAAVEKLQDDIGIPKRLRDLGVKQDQLHPFAEKAHGIRRILRVNPRQPSVEDVEKIYQEAY
jgi:alcohol dehydrogenase class IV